MGSAIFDREKKRANRRVNLSSGRLWFLRKVRKIQSTDGDGSTSEWRMVTEHKTPCSFRRETEQTPGTPFRNCENVRLRGFILFRQIYTITNAPGDIAAKMVNTMRIHCTDVPIQCYAYSVTIYNTIVSSLVLHSV